MSVSVDVNVVGTEAPPEAEAVVARAVKAALAHHEVEHASISVTLMGDDEITEMNRQYLQHDYVTDVVSFPLYEEGENPVGDIYIGWDQVRRQADDAGVEFPEEAARIAIHGTLHVLGYDHPDDESRMQSDMWQTQEKILSELHDRF